MPNFVGMPIVTVQVALTRVGLKSAPPAFVDVHVPDVTPANAPPPAPVVPGSVIGQQPAAGARVDQATEVKLTVAK
jgi:beta-lactam-binding protein with PASTA domain